MNSVEKNILHVLPDYGLGGAELAALSAASRNKNVFVVFLRNRIRKKIHNTNMEFCHRKNIFDLKVIIELINIIDKVNPSIIVFSLWKSVFAFLAVKILRPKIKIAIFLHSSESMHKMDYYCNFFMVKNADYVLADSFSTSNRFRNIKSKPCRVVSFCLRCTTGSVRYTPKPKFLFWGRITEQKNIPQAISFFQIIRSEYPSAEFLLIGPDGGMLTELKAVVRDAGLTNCVRFDSAKEFDEIAEMARDYCFFLQLSRLEGMSMSVVEAMQQGLIPVVTPVGEIANYCREMENGVNYSGEEETFAKICFLLQDADAFSRISRAAIDTWKDAPLYADDFIVACEEFLTKPAA